ncbi:hypothetical protein [Curtobacterium sp. PhB136]|uniref:hypothetical protein n=1 Tax=Curtobacterium sp. PhB136 TaxID=2485181 RepID=UPI00104D9F77|nr:hypothetical protein [Curtobacterium sp. PhB136]TCK65773.1 hypothetical protein EDF27_0514 [Curtobacterium sp. PhB136]
MKSSPTEEPYLDVCIFSTPRTSEMDWSMEQAIATMPTHRVHGANVKVHDAVVEALRSTDPSIETVQYYGQLGTEVLHVVLPGADAADNVPRAWTRNWDAYGLIHGVRADGSVIADGGLMSDLTVADLRRSAGRFGNGPNTRVIVIAPMGLGDGSYVLDFGAFLLDHGVDIGTVAYGAWALGRKRWRKQSTLRKVRAAVQTLESGGLSQPWAIRQFIDSEDAWQAANLAKLLRIRPESARQLLLALGYERRRDGAWVTSETRAARKRRRKWEDSERWHK